MPTVRGQCVTPLAGQPCANPACKNMIPARAVHHLCWPCDAHWRRYVVPAAGFLPSATLKFVASKLVDELKPTPAKTAAAIKIMRGPRHRTGDWSKRPAYRLQPLLHGRWNQRLPNLLVGRRKIPTIMALIKAVVHYHLANQIIGTGSYYSQYLAGATFYERRAPIAPTGAVVLKGQQRTAGYRLSAVDYSCIGRLCLKAVGELGVDPKSRATSDRIVSLFAQGVTSGACRGPVVLPNGAFATKAAGDHPLDHVFSKTCPVPPRFIGSIRRASGLIKRVWPEGMDLSWEEVDHLRRQPRPNPYAALRTTSAPDVSWIFN